MFRHYDKCIYAEWVNVVHFCIPGRYGSFREGGGGLDPLPPSPGPPPPSAHATPCPPSPPLPLSVALAQDPRQLIKGGKVSSPRLHIGTRGRRKHAAILSAVIRGMGARAPGGPRGLQTGELTGTASQGNNNAFGGRQFWVWPWGIQVCWPTTGLSVRAQVSFSTNYGPLGQRLPGDRRQLTATAAG